MKVLVLGGSGYIGSVLSEYLKEKGDEVIVYDNYLYEAEKLSKDDIRDINRLIPVIEQADAVVNLAAISNDPASDLQPSLTWEVNYKANEVIAQMCQASNKRIIFASSCSMYGSSDNEMTEESKLKPLTLYARTKMLSEELYLHKDIDSVILRLATVYGASPKPRFDLVVNTMIGAGYFNNKITVNGGDQWRPTVHVKDVANAIWLALSPLEPQHRVYNVGSNEQNYQISELGQLIYRRIPNAALIFNDSQDKRNYKVNFDRIKELGFEAKYTINDAVDELYAQFKDGEIKNMEEDVYYRVKYLQHHL